MTFTRRFTVNAPLDAVTAFHSHNQALKWLTPPPIWIQFHQIEPLAEGSTSQFTMWLGPLPIRWTAVHTQVTAQGFTDTQQRGPFHAWQHRHSFKTIDTHTTEVIDEIEAEPGNLLSRLMWLTLPLLFLYRRWQTRRLCAEEGRR